SFNLSGNGAGLGQNFGVSSGRRVAARAWAAAPEELSPMPRSALWSAAFSLLVFLLSGCASERAPINRVQPEALQKSFFVGASLTSDADDPAFYYRPTVADVDYGAGQSGLFTASYAQTTDIVRWEITEDKLIARLAYERIACSTGKGIDETNTGQIAAAFKSDKHFDVR